MESSSFGLFLFFVFIIWFAFLDNQPRLHHFTFRRCRAALIETLVALLCLVSGIVHDVGNAMPLQFCCRSQQTDQMIAVCHAFVGQPVGDLFVGFQNGWTTVMQPRKFVVRFEGYNTVTVNLITVVIRPDVEESSDFQEIQMTCHIRPCFLWFDCDALWLWHVHIVGCTFRCLCCFWIGGLPFVEAFGEYDASLALIECSFVQSRL